MRGLNYALMKGAEFLFPIISQVEIDIGFNITYQHYEYQCAKGLPQVLLPQAQGVGASMFL